MSGKPDEVTPRPAPVERSRKAVVVCMEAARYKLQTAVDVLLADGQRSRALELLRIVCELEGHERSIKSESAFAGYSPNAEVSR